MVDVGVDAGHDDVAGQHGPVVPLLVHPEAAPEVGPVQRAARPAPCRRVEPVAIWRAEVDFGRQLVLVRRHAALTGRRGPALPWRGTRDFEPPTLTWARCPDSSIECSSVS